MAQPFVITQGQLSPSAAYPFIVAGGPFDLTGCSVTFSMRPAGAATLTVDHSPAVIVGDPLEGNARYDWVLGDTALAGPYAGWFTATLPNGKKQDTPEFEVEVSAHTAPGPYALVTLDELEDHLKLENQVRKVKDNDKQELRRLILAASNRCEEFTSHRFAVETGVTKTFRYDGDELLNMDPWDLRAITSVLIDTDTAPYPYDSSQYRLEPRNSPHGIFTHLALPPYQAARARSGANFWGGGGPTGVGYPQFGREVQVTGDWGWTTIPQGIKDGVLTLAARKFVNPLGAQQVENQAVKMRFSGGTGGGGAVGDGLPDEVASAWRPYVRAAA